MQKTTNHVSSKTNSQLYKGLSYILIYKWKIHKRIC